MASPRAVAARQDDLQHFVDDFHRADRGGLGMVDCARG
jgi:hypothetical protein